METVSRAVGVGVKILRTDPIEPQITTIPYNEVSLPTLSIPLPVPISISLPCSCCAYCRRVGIAAVETRTKDPLHPRRSLTKTEQIRSSGENISADTP